MIMGLNIGAIASTQLFVVVAILQNGQANSFDFLLNNLFVK